MLDLTDTDSGYMPCVVFINGERTEVRVDVYDAIDHLQAAGKGYDDAVPPAVLKEAAASFLHGSPDDWNGHTALRFWKAIQDAVKDLGNDVPAENTPS